jgi:hypothetical protein
MATTIITHLDPSFEENLRTEIKEEVDLGLLTISEEDIFFVINQSLLNSIPLEHIIHFINAYEIASFPLPGLDPLTRKEKFDMIMNAYNIKYNPN